MININYDGKRAFNWIKKNDIEIPVRYKHFLKSDDVGYYRYFQICQIESFIGIVQDIYEKNRMKGMTKWKKVRKTIRLNTKILL